MPPLHLASAIVTNHVRGGGGKVSFVVTGDENLLKRKGHPDGQRGLKLCWSHRRSHRRLGTPQYWAGDGEKCPFPAKSPLGAASDLGGSENLRGGGGRGERRTLNRNTKKSKGKQKDHP